MAISGTLCAGSLKNYSMNIVQRNGGGRAMATSKRGEQAERRRAQLIDVALELFAERGIDAVRISDIAERAGVAQGLLYHYFDGKPALLGAIAERYSPLALLRELLTDLPNRPAREVVTGLAEQVYALVQERRALVRMVVRDVLWRPEMREVAMWVRKTSIGYIARYLESRVAAGELRPHDGQVVAQTLASAVFLPSIAELPFDPYITGAIELILRGVAVDPDSI
jgi:AcrR family transcriptional regulator